MYIILLFLISAKHVNFHDKKVDVHHIRERKIFPKNHCQYLILFKRITIQFTSLGAYSTDLHGFFFQWQCPCMDMYRAP